MFYIYIELSNKAHSFIAITLDVIAVPDTVIMVLRQ